MTAGYTVPKDWDDDESAAHAVSGIVPRSAAQRIIVAREERDASRQMLAKHMSGVTRMNDARCRARERHVQSVDEWLKDKESAFAKLVPARPVGGEARSRRGR